MPISTRMGHVLVAELSLTDLSDAPKWRVFSEAVAPGTVESVEGADLSWSVTPGEITVLGERPGGVVVDLTHVRVMFRLTGEQAATLMNRVCALDLTEGMFPSGAAARTLFAGVATEVVRDDQGGTPSYLIIPSRSFGRYIRDVIEDAGAEFGLSGPGQETG